MTDREDSEASLGGFSTVDASASPTTLVRLLDVMSESAAERKRRTHALMGLAPGMTALDVGCGTGDDVRALAEIVGTRGLAIGVDRSETMLAVARDRAAGSANQVYVRANATDLCLGSESVDAARCERILEHTRDPGRAVRELARVVRRGGSVVVYEPDWGGLLLDVPSPTTAAVLAAVASRIESASVGRELRRHLADAGLTEIAIVPDVWTLTSYEVASDLLRLDLTLEAAVRAGTLTREAAADWLVRARMAGSADRFFAALTFFTATGVKS